MLFSVSFLALLALDQYSVPLGLFHISAGALFKPLLLLNGAFLALVLLARRQPAAEANETGSCGAPLGYGIAAIVATALGCHFLSVFINIADTDWNHREVSSAIHSIRDLGGLFIHRQGDGFYRPMAFASLWLDHLVFGDYGWGYHAVNIAIHAANSVLVALTTIALGFQRGVAVWAGLLFAAGAAAFETVLWPAARFDLLATFFSLAALLFVVRFLAETNARLWTLLPGMACFAAALLNKESAYALPLLAAFVTITWNAWRAERPAASGRIAALGALGAVAVAAVAARLAIYHGLSGYESAAGGGIVHFGLSVKSVTSVFMRLPLGLLGFNSAVPVPIWMRVSAAAFALSLLAIAAYRTPALPFRVRALPALALLAAIPTLNIIIWISPAMQHGRFLYLPAVWLSILLAAVAYRHPWRRFLLAAFLAANAAGVTHNLEVYRRALGEAATAARTRTGDSRDVILCNVPREPKGVFFYRSELMHALEKTGARVSVVSVPACRAEMSPGRAVYTWSDDGPGRLRLLD